MAKSSAIEDALSRLAAVRGNPITPGAKEELARALDSKINLVVQRAAKIIGDTKLMEFAPALIRAFDRFIPPDKDRGCDAKLAIATALYEMGAEAGEIFMTGVRLIQSEGGYGGSSDSASTLRGICALGLVRIAHREALVEITDLLTDREPQARIMAARALAYSARDEGALLLRLKLNAGDREPEVIAECVTALLKLSPLKAIPFVAKFIDDGDEVIQESVALALGETRRREAFDVLREHFETRRWPALQPTLALAIAVTRLPEAIQFLTTQIASAPAALAMDTLEAMKIYRHDESLRAGIQKALEQRTDKVVREKFEQLFVK